MIIKVCGVKDKANIRNLSELKFDMIGLNFYQPSVRYVDNTPAEWYDHLPYDLKRAGVFVNHSKKEILALKDKYSLDYAQLHGDENEKFGRELSHDIDIIKVFRVRIDFDFSVIKKHDYATMYIFDTYTDDYGGSGKQFNWAILNNYKGIIPFLLSGGLSPQSIESIKNYYHPQFAGIDINSKFESSPGIKNVDIINEFISKLNK